MGFILVGIYVGKWAQIDFVLYLLSVFACKFRMLEGRIVWGGNSSVKQLKAPAEFIGVLVTTS
jgi:hypothetical protein